MKAITIILGATWVLLVMLAAGANAQQQGADRDAFEEIVVTGAASRLPASLSTFPGSVTRIDTETIRAISAITNDIAQVLALEVPGLGVTVRGSASNFEQSIRGRKPAILIDGVPIGSPLRDGRHDVRSLTPQVLQSVEVIRGSSALYGNGGAGGVINYITRSGAGEGIAWQTEAGTEFSLTSVDDSMAPFLRQSGSGSVGAFSFNTDIYLETTESHFDARGQRIRPSPNGQGGLAESDIYSAFLRLGYDFGGQRIGGSVLVYDQEQDSKYNILIPGDPANEIPVSVQEGPKAPGADNPKNSNLLLNLVYSHEDVLGSSLHIQGYYQDYENVFDYTTFFPGGGNSRITSEKNGLRLDIQTPLRFTGEEGALLWGIDVLNDETGQDLTDGRVWAPLVDQGSIAGFFQATLPVNEFVTVNAGFRYESIDVSYPGFTALFSGADVPPGDNDYSADTFNLGLTYAFTDTISGFAAFSQGFSVAEIGRVLRGADEDSDFSVAGLEASVVDNYELGLRFNGDSFSTEVAVYFSDSNLGTSVTNDFQIVRQPEEIYGVEVSFDGAIGESWDLGGTFTWSSGERDSNGDGELDRDLPSNRVNPAKLTGYINHTLNDIVSLRLQATHSAGRDLFEERLAFGESPVEPYTLIDASLAANFGKSGELTLGISNLTNEEYFTVASYLFFDTTRSSRGKGIGARIGYSISY